MHSTLKHKIGETVCFYGFDRFFECLLVLINNINNLKRSLSFSTLYYSFLYFKVKVIKNLYMLYGCKDFMS
jgi:predicted metal-dependent peptidase